MPEVQVSSEVVADAYTNFAGMFYPKLNGVGCHFWAFIGLTKPPSTSMIVDAWIMPEGPARCARLLAGPHYQTVAKAMLARGHQHLVPVDP